MISVTTISAAERTLSDAVFDVAAIPLAERCRVTTLNMLHSEYLFTERAHLVAAELKQLGTQIFCAQEVVYGRNGVPGGLEIIAAETDLVGVVGRDQLLINDGISSGTAIMTSLECLSTGSFRLGSRVATNDEAIYAVVLAPSGQAVIVVTAHLCWGGDKGRERLLQMTELDRHVWLLLQKFRHLDPVVAMTGDFNAAPESDLNSYLRGNTPGATGRYTFWADAFEAVGNPVEGATVEAGNVLAQQTARKVGIRYPSMMPDRRIDYIWTRGWTYGRPGMAINIQRCFTEVGPHGVTASDHYGLTSDLWTPAP